MTENTFLNYYLGRFINVLNSFSAEKYLKDYLSLYNLENTDDVYFYWSSGSLFESIKTGYEKEFFSRKLDFRLFYLHCHLGEEFGICKFHDDIPMLDTRMIIVAIPKFSWKDFVNFEENKNKRETDTLRGNIYRGDVFINDNNYVCKHSDGVQYIDIPIVKDERFLESYVESNEFTYSLYFSQYLHSIFINDIEYMPIRAEFYYKGKSLLVSEEEMDKKGNYKGKEECWIDEKVYTNWYKNNKKLSFKDP